MKSFAFAFISALIFSPVSLAHYNTEGYSDDREEIKIEKDHFPGRKAKITIEIDTHVGAPSRSPSCLHDAMPCARPVFHRFSFKCGRKKISGKKILKAANAACPKIRTNPQKSAFPSLFTAFNYNLPGPYVEWPINFHGHYWNKFRTSKRRLVMTTHCEVIGAVIRDRKGFYTACDYVME